MRNCACSIALLGAKLDCIFLRISQCWQEVCLALNDCFLFRVDVDAGGDLTRSPSPRYGAASGASLHPSWEHPQVVVGGSTFLPPAGFLAGLGGLA